MERQDKLNSKASKVTTQAKSASNILRPHNNHAKGLGVSSFPKAEEEERVYGSTGGAKRTYMDISSPRIDKTKSPSINEEASPDASDNGFVTARAKLVCFFLWKTQCQFLLHLKHLNLCFWRFAHMLGMLP